MRKFIIFLILIALIGAGYYYREDIKEFFKKEETETEKILRALPKKEVEIFTVGEKIDQLSFKKSALSSSSINSTVTAQISGTITDLSIELGDRVNKNEILLTLGESFSTDMADLQVNSAQENYNLSRSQEELTRQGGNNSVEGAQIGLQIAAQNYENSLITLENNEEIFDDQLETLDFTIETAEKAYEDAKDAYKELKDQIDETKDPAQVAQLQAELKKLKTAKEATKNQLEQTELAQEQAQDSQIAQIDQLEHGIDMALLQYQAAINQYESAISGTGIQYLGSLSQLVQANTALKSAKLSQDQRHVRSPIDGIITSVQVIEGNFIAPGQILLKIENPDTISIKVNLNPKEAYLLKVGDTVLVNDQLTGTIVSISPTVNSANQKIEAEIEINEENSLTPGLLVKVEFFPNIKDKIFIPLNSLYLDEEKKFVKVVDENSKIKFKEVIIGKILNNYIEIIAGIKEGERVLKTQIDLEENETVNIQKNGEA